MPTIIEQMEVLRRERLSQQRTVQSPPPVRGALTINSGQSIMAQVRANVARRNSMMATQRYALADEADEKMGLLKSAGVTGLSTALKILDVINTPQQMLFGAAIGLTDGKGIVDGAIAGARENVTGSDLLEALDFGEGGSVNLPVIGKVTGRGVLGLALDFLIDIPIFGAIGKGAKIARLPQLAKFSGGKVVKGAQSLRKTGVTIRGKEIVSQEFLDSALGQYRVFQTKTERKITDLIMESRRGRKGAIGRKKLIASQFGKRVEDLAKKKDLTPAELKRQLADVLERKTGVQMKLGGVKLKDWEIPKTRPQDVIKGGTRIDPATAAMKSELKNAGVKGKQMDLNVVAADVEALRDVEVAIRAERKDLLSLSRKERDKGLTKFALRSSDEPFKAGQSTVISGVDDDVFNLAMDAQQLFRDGLIQEINHGVATFALDDKWVDYLTHFLNPIAKRKMLNARTAGALEFQNSSRLNVYNPTHSFQLLRKWQGISVNEMNDLGRRALVPGFEGIHFEKMFTDDISTLLAARLVSGAKAIADAKLFTQAATRLGKNADDLGKAGMEGWQKLAITASQDDRIKPLGTYLNRFVFEPDVAKHLNAYFDVISNPRASNAFLQKFDRVQGMWKASTLFMFPAYHSRNFVSNLFNNNLADPRMFWPNRFGSTGYYSAARDYLPTKAMTSKLGKTPLETITLGGKKYTRQEMDHLLEQQGILNQFREFLAIPEVKIGVKELPGGPGLGRIPGVGKATQLGIDAGSWIENNARIAHFFSKLDSGKTARQAGLSVKKYLFNYDELTQIEQSFFRRVWPFMAWTRHNLPLQVSSIVTNPKPFSRLKDIIDFVESDSERPVGEDVIIQDWMKENSPVRTRVDAEGNPEYFLLGGWLPAADLGKITRPWDIIEEELSPFIKEPFEQLLNFDAFLEKKIIDFPGQKEKFIGLNLPKRFVAMARNIRLLSTLDSIGATVEGQLREGKTGIFSQRAAKGIWDQVLSQTAGFNIRAVNKDAALRGVAAQMQDLKRLLRRELRAEREANAETVKEELLSMVKRLGE